jgi:3-phytase
MNLPSLACAALAFGAALVLPPCLADVPMGRAMPTVEVPNEAGPENDMDDPAIWIHPDPGQAARSLVIATAKRGGIRVYDLHGRIVQKIASQRDAQDRPLQRFNNVDVQYDFAIAGRKVDIAVASDRIGDQLRVWRIDRSRTAPLTDITDAEMPRVFATRPDPADRVAGTLPNPDDGKRTAYGLALYRDRTAGRYFALVTQAGEAVVAKWELVATQAGRVSARFVKEWRFPYTHQGQDLTHEEKGNPARSFSPQFEGLVVDQQTGIAYAGQEDVGIWRIHLKGGRDEAEAKPFVATRAFDPASPLARDVEGLTIYYGVGGAGYLIASSQGAAHGKNPVPIPELDDSFAVFAREGDNRYLGSFRLVANTAKGIDAVQECDGADVTSVSLPGFPGGLLITQDGYNDDNFGGGPSNTNMKFTPWESVARGFPGGLQARTNYNPRRP